MARVSGGGPVAVPVASGCFGVPVPAGRIGRSTLFLRFRSSVAGGTWTVGPCPVHHRVPLHTQSFPSIKASETPAWARCGILPPHPLPPLFICTAASGPALLLVAGLHSQAKQASFCGTRLSCPSCMGAKNRLSCTWLLTSRTELIYGELARHAPLSLPPPPPSPSPSPPPASLPARPGKKNSR